MSTKKQNESLDVVVARIDERVAVMHECMPRISKRVDRHDREILVAKVIAVLCLVIAATKFPVLADAIGRMIAP